jgi:hypothetical protein
MELTEDEASRLKMLQLVGISDLDELETQLMSDAPNMAKVFLRC